MAGGTLFNADWYVRNNPDVADAVSSGQTDAWTHFQNFGRFEDRAPGPQFDPAYYLSQNPDVQSASDQDQTTAYDHFTNFGVTEGRSFVSYFDRDFYVEQNPDIKSAVAQGQTTPEAHFLNFGRTEARAISPFFSLAAYLDANLDVKEAAEAGVLDPLTHLLEHGVQEARDLGNGVNLAQFANDPVFQEAIAEGGDPLAAVARVAEVAPFLPTFEAPEGWEAPADTPIPVDFVPVEGEKLVVPPSVEVPEDIVLPPDTFEPVDPEEPVEPGEPLGPQEPVDLSEFELGHDQNLSDFATTSTGNMLAGSGNSGAGFLVNHVELDMPEGWEGESAPILEIGLGAQIRNGDVYTPSDEGVIEVGEGEIPTFKFSVGTDSTETLADLLATYDIKLRVDTDASEAVNFITLTAVESETLGEGALDWEFSAEGDLISDTDNLDDDGGDAHVSQNIQALSWYLPDDDGDLFGPTEGVPAGTYDVELLVYDRESVELVGATGITFDVDGTVT